MTVVRWFLGGMCGCECRDTQIGWGYVGKGSYRTGEGNVERDRKKGYVGREGDLRGGSGRCTCVVSDVGMGYVWMGI